MNEAYMPGRTAAVALQALSYQVAQGETEPVIDMYERAAWMSGATRNETAVAIRWAREDRKGRKE